MMETKLIRKGIIGRLLKTILKFYPVMMPVTIVCIIFSAIVCNQQRNYGDGSSAGGFLCAVAAGGHRL